MKVNDTEVLAATFLQKKTVDDNFDNNNDNCKGFEHSKHKYGYIDDNSLNESTNITEEVKQTGMQYIP